MDGPAGCPCGLSRLQSLGPSPQAWGSILSPCTEGEARGQSWIPVHRWIHTYAALGSLTWGSPWGQAMARTEGWTVPLSSMPTPCPGLGKGLGALFRAEQTLTSFVGGALALPLLVSERRDPPGPVTPAVGEGGVRPCGQSRQPGDLWLHMPRPPCGTVDRWGGHVAGGSLREPP